MNSYAVMQVSAIIVGLALASVLVSPWFILGYALIVAAQLTYAKLG